MLLSLYLNTRLIEPVYIYIQKQALEAACARLLQESADFDSLIKQVEENSGVIVVRTENTAENVVLNERLKQAFIKKGIGMEDYWLWEEDYETTMKTGSQRRIYSQGRLNYSLMVQYLVRGPEFLAVTIVIPNISGTVALVNNFSVLLFGGTALLLLGLVWLTNRRLERARLELQNKNSQMQTLLGHVSHDLKTPISLIKAYTAGMRDGLDDGTFLDTVIGQNEQMERMTEQLLELSRKQLRVSSLEKLDVGGLLKQSLAAYSLRLSGCGLELQADIAAPAFVVTDQAAITSIFDNLLSNAVKYSAGGALLVSLCAQGKGWRFTISNACENAEQLNTEQLWSPFYVGEPSRNKALSGTGLGLAIVRACCDSLGYRHGHTARDGMFSCWVQIE